MTVERSADITEFSESVLASHRDHFLTLQRLIDEVAPQSEASLKWGTIAYDLDGSLFALSANKKHVNLYILTVGLLAEFKGELAGIPQSKCVLRFTPKAELPLETLRTVMTEAVARKGR
ncbi:MAG: DUF1801 domain-containing protein [Acidobacteriota bacterium]